MLPPDNERGPAPGRTGPLEIQTPSHVDADRSPEVERPAAPSRRRISRRVYRRPIIAHVSATREALAASRAAGGTIPVPPLCGGPDRLPLTPAQLEHAPVCAECVRRVYELQQRAAGGPS